MPARAAKTKGRNSARAQAIDLAGDSGDGSDFVLSAAESDHEESEAELVSEGHDSDAEEAAPPPSAKKRKRSPKPKKAKAAGGAGAADGEAGAAAAEAGGEAGAAPAAERDPNLPPGVDRCAQQCCCGGHVLPLSAAVLTT